MAAIHQLVAGFARGDAISNEALVLRRIFRGWGCDSVIFSERKRIMPDLRAEAFDVSEAPARCGAEDIALLHLSIGSPVNEAFRALACRKALLYHNVTPPEYYRFVQPRTAVDLENGRRDLRALAGAAAVNFADSRFNAAELVAAGYGPAGVLPLVLDLDALRAAPDRGVLETYGDGKVNVLFVGRCAPNKKLEDVLMAFAVFQKTVCRNSRLIHVGSFAGTERYHHVLVSMARELQVSDVVFAGAVPQAELIATYQAAHAFLCMSEHEGFCIPLLEAMLHGVPVVAFAAAAVPETMDGAGILFDRKDWGAVAEMLGRVAEPGPLRTAVRAGQADRIERFRRRDPEAELRALLAPLR